MALAKEWMRKDPFYGYKMAQDETDPFLTHHSPLLSCTRLSFVSVDTSAKASPVKDAKTKMSRTSAKRHVAPL